MEKTTRPPQRPVQHHHRDADEYGVRHGEGDVRIHHHRPRENRRRPVFKLIHGAPLHLPPASHPVPHLHRHQAPREQDPSPPPPARLNVQFALIKVYTLWRRRRHTSYFFSCHDADIGSAGERRPQTSKRRCLNWQKKKHAAALVREMHHVNGTEDLPPLPPPCPRAPWGGYTARRSTPRRSGAS